MAARRPGTSRRGGRHRALLAGTVIAVVALAGVPGGALGAYAESDCTTTWTGGSGSIGDPTWSDGTPGATDIACITNGGTVETGSTTVTVAGLVVTGTSRFVVNGGAVLRLQGDQASTFATLAMTGGRLAPAAIEGPGAIEITGTFAWEGDVRGPAGSTITLRAGSTATWKGGGASDRSDLDTRNLIVEAGATLVTELVGGGNTIAGGARIDVAGTWLHRGRVLPAASDDGSATGSLHILPGGIVRADEGLGDLDMDIVNDGRMEATGAAVLSISNSSTTGDAPRVNVDGLGDPARRTLSGTGAISPALTHGNQTVAPGGLATAGTLTVEGPLSYRSGNPHVAIEIGGTGPGQYDQIVASGPVVVGPAFELGTLALSTLAGYTPVAGDTFDVITGASLTGDGFKTITGTELPGGFTLEVSYTANAVRVTVAGGTQTAVPATAATSDGPATPVPTWKAGFASHGPAPVPGTVSGDGSGSAALVVIAGVLGLGAVLFVVLLLRRRSTKDGGGSGASS